MHVLHHVQLAAAGMGPFFFDQRFGDHADHAATGLQAGIGHHAHQAVVSAAIDQLAFVVGNPAAYHPGGFGIDRLGTGPRAAIHTQ